MARLNTKTRYVLGQIECLETKIAVRSDGKVLKNNGGSWKEWRRVKDNTTPEQALEALRESQKEFRKENPCFAAYAELLMEMYPSFHRRILVLAIVNIMPNDPDGIYSELQDHNMGISLEEAVRIVRARQAWKIEEQAKRYNLTVPLNKEPERDARGVTNVTI